MSEPSYSQVIDQLLRASIPIRQLANDGHIAVTPTEGRVVAMAFSQETPNLFWSNPQLPDTTLVRNHPEKLVGGFGGDRLWFAPELAFHWDGAPDWHVFTNYKVPQAASPGNYRFVDDGDRAHITLHAVSELPVHGSAHRMGFEVSRRIRMADPPLPKTDSLMRGVDYVGIETSHTLRLAEGTRKGLIDLWHLLQVPVGSALIVPLKKDVQKSEAKPLSYGLPGRWEERADHILWRYGGEAQAKLGLSAAALTGRSAVLRRLTPDRWCLIVRQFAVDPKARYGDHPHGMPREDQAFQAWDGLGFGEMEFHSPVLDAAQGPREMTESDQLWAFGGTAQTIAPLAERLLGVDVRYLLTT